MKGYFAACTGGNMQKSWLHMQNSFAVPPKLSLILVEAFFPKVPYPHI